MFYHKNLKLMDNLKSKAYRNVWRKIRVQFSCCRASSSIHRNVGRCIQSSGIELSIDIRTISFGGCCFESGRKEAGVALIDIGGGTTDLFLKMVLFVIQQ
jgi:hypothetical protein